MVDKLRQYLPSFLVILSVQLLFWSVNSLSAQQNDPEPIIVEVVIQGLWSIDSQVFTFKEITHDAWVAYDVNNKQISTASLWPLQPDLAPADYLEFEVFRNLINGLPIGTYIAPNSRYIAYAHEIRHVSNLYSFLAVADLQTRQHVILDIPIYTPDPHPYLFAVKWSNDSHAFTVQSTFSGGPIQLYYVSGFQTEIMNLTAIELLTLFRENQPAYNSHQIHDISDDGSQVVIGGNFDDPHDRKLAIWDANLNEIIQIIDVGRIEAAAFDPRSRDSLLIAARERIYSHNFLNNQQTDIPLMNTELTAFGEVAFSPNRLWVALAQYENISPGKLYIIPLFAEAPIFTASTPPTIFEDAGPQNIPNWANLLSDFFTDNTFAKMRA